MLIQGVAYANTSMSDLFNKYSTNIESVPASNVVREVSPDNTINKPVFKLVDLDGNIFTNQNTNGKYLIVNFWATWCKPCLQEIPEFVKFYNNHSDKALILGMSYEKAERKDVENYVDKLNVNYPIILYAESNTSHFSKFTEIKGMPTTVIYNPEGELASEHLGQINLEIIKGEVL